MSKPTYTLHTVYNSAEFEDGLWVCSSDPKQTLRADQLLIDLDGKAANILRAKKKAAGMLGITPGQIETASYLQYYEK